MANMEYIKSLSSAAMLLGTCYLFFKILRFGHREKHLPPGPPTIPVLGNALALDPQRTHLQFKEWSDQYGPIFSLKVGQSTIVVLNDPRAVHELLHKKGALYVDRPADEQWDLATNNEVFVLMHYGETWRAIKKIAAQMLSPKNIDGNLAAIQEAEITQMMLDLLEKPEDFRGSVHRTSASVASIVLYGQRAPDWKSFWASDINNTITLLVKSVEPGGYLPTSQFPILKLIPEGWVPSKKHAKNACRLNTRLFAKARELVEVRRRNGDIRESLIDSLLDGVVQPDVPLTYSQTNSGLLGTLHQGASETSSKATLTNILFLAKYPHFQEKARVELDRVCGTERMPCWSDFKDIPYVNCIIKEGLRIRPVLPIGIPYRAKEDVWYNGMLIPKDATIFLPIYALNHTYYSDAATYNPDRYLGHPKSSADYANSSDYKNRDHYSFGSGRRMCVGMHLGERTLWRMIAQILWAFKIEPAVDDHGRVLELDPDAYDGGMAVGPLAFQVRFVPRSARHAEVVRKAAADCQDFLKQWE